MLMSQRKAVSTRLTESTLKDAKCFGRCERKELIVRREKTTNLIVQP